MSKVPLYVRILDPRINVVNRFRVGWVKERGTTRAEDAQGTPTQSHISLSILVYGDDEAPQVPPPPMEREGFRVSLHSNKTGSGVPRP